MDSAATEEEQLAVAVDYLKQVLKNIGSPTKYQHYARELFTAGSEEAGLPEETWPEQAGR
ncbi:hypothetical protein GCM10009733_021370 [Nonomuraea maheshkhaliensis]|uniref:Uncharacterized protein n=1 Tax=Nonomuraea maheshkhaliensis TaxID=419590 RepID=A0ABP4R1D0_9ACTN